MNKEDIKRRVCDRIDGDDKIASEFGKALDKNDDYWLAQLIGEVVGVIVYVGSTIWRWVVEIFS